MTLSERAWRNAAGEHFVGAVKPIALPVARRARSAAFGLLADRLVGEPPAAVHPVSAFGSLMTRLERLIWADRRSAGVAYATAGVVLGAAAGMAMRSTTGAVALTAAGRELRRVAVEVADLLEVGDVEGARAALPALVGRDPGQLDESGIAAAVIESVAENSVDAVVAPVFWAVVAGAPGAVAYRAVNTMDAMVGRLDDRYRQFGWAAARLDDVANYVPARLFAVLVAVLRPSRARTIWKAIRLDAPAHPSPNAGVAEAAVAAALGCELGGPLRYGTRHENRPRLGEGPRPSATDIATAVRLASQAELLLTTVAAVAWLFARRERGPMPRCAPH